MADYGFNLSSGPIYWKNSYFFSLPMHYNGEPDLLFRSWQSAWILNSIPYWAKCDLQTTLDSHWPCIQEKFVKGSLFGSLISWYLKTCSQFTNLSVNFQESGSGYNNLKVLKRISPRFYCQFIVLFVDDVQPYKITIFRDTSAEILLLPLFVQILSLYKFWRRCEKWERP